MILIVAKDRGEAGDLCKKLGIESVLRRNETVVVDHLLMHPCVVETQPHWTFIIFTEKAVEAFKTMDNQAVAGWMGRSLTHSWPSPLRPDYDDWIDLCKKTRNEGERR